nr:GAF domain-containing protein [Motilibacter deserti]
MLATITRSARQLFGARACSIALLTEDDSELVYTTASGEGEDDVTGMRLPSGTGIAGWVVMSGQPVAISDLESDARFARDVAEGTGYVPRAMLAVPVNDGDRVLGVMTLLDRDDGRPGAEQDMALLAVFADQTALTLRTERALGDLGRTLLATLARAAGDGTDLAAAADRAGDEVPPVSADLLELAGLFADLQRMGEAEHRLALRVVREVTAYAARRRPRAGR